MLLRSLLQVICAPKVLHSVGDFTSLRQTRSNTEAHRLGCGRSSADPFKHRLDQKGANVHIEAWLTAVRSGLQTQTPG